MGKSRRLLPALLLGIFILPVHGFAAGKCERVIVTGSPDAPPYLWRNPQDPKHLMGANADLFKRAAQDIGLKVEILYAGKRSQALDEVRSGRIDLLIDTPLSAAELDSLDYIHPAIVQTLSLPSDVITQPSPLDSTGLYLALSFNSACNEPWLRGQLTKKMTEFAASGLSGDAVALNLELWNAQVQQASAPNK